MAGRLRAVRSGAWKDAPPPFAGEAPKPPSGSPHLKHDAFEARDAATASFPLAAGARAATAAASAPLRFRSSRRERAAAADAADAGSWGKPDMLF